MKRARIAGVATNNSDQPIGLLRQLGGGAAAKIVTLPITAFATLGSSALIISATDSVTFGIVSLLGSLFLLIPFADLGLGASIVNAVAVNGRRSKEDSALFVIRKAVSLLFVSAIIVMSIALILSISGLWRVILNLDSEFNWTADWAPTLALLPFALSLPLSIGTRILIGIRKNHIVTLISTLGPIANIVTTFVFLHLGLEPLLLSIAPAIGVFTSSVVTLLWASRNTGWSLFDFIPNRSSHNQAGVRIWNTAGPMLILSIVVPLSIQLQRYFVTHLDKPELPEYSLVAQLYFPCYGIVATAAVALWPMFKNPSGTFGLWRKSMAIMIACGSVAFLGFSLLAIPISDLVSGDSIDISIELVIAFASLLFVMAAHQPSAMLLTDGIQLRFQAGAASIALLASIGVSWWLTPIAGASAPVWSTVACTLLAQVIPCAVRAQRFQRKSQIA